MNWVEKDFPTIPGYESLGDNVEAKRWLDFKLNQLLDTGDPLWEYRSQLRTREDVCNFVISQFDYPFSRGLPTDHHLNNWFHRNSCHAITQDFWQTASETLRTLRLNQKQGKKGFGDCEDISVLFTTLFLMKRWQAYEIFGAVLEGGQLLGYHAWSIFRDAEGQWRLYESTLDEPPEYPRGYPVINAEENSWKVGDVTYRAYAKFNRKEYYENQDGDVMGGFLRVGLNRKETKRKYEALSRAWHQKAKPLEKAGLLSRVRWRK